MISSDEFAAYNRAVARIGDKAASEVESSVLAWCRDNASATVAEKREAAKLIMDGYIQGYDDIAAEFAAEWYDHRAEKSGIKLDQAITMTTYSPESVDEVARYQAKKLLNGDDAAFAKACGEYARNDLFRSLNETIIANVGRDKDKGARFARIPTGFETCTFCMMLASRNAVYHTRKTAGEFKHFHRHCDCKVVPSFDPNPDAEVVEGVKPRELYDQWKACKRVDDEISAPSLTKAAVKRQLIVNPAANLNSPLEVAVPWLRAIDMYYVPDRKINSYALSYTGNENKTTAFELALGFAPCDAAEVIRQLYEWIADNPPTYRGKGTYGDEYTSKLIMKGNNGKTAKVIAGFIFRPDDDKMQLTSIYVDE